MKMNKINEYEIMSFMQNIEYGWMDKNNNKHLIVDETYSDNYLLQSPHEVIQNKVGVCWDQVELERYYFKDSFMNIKTYFLVHYDKDQCPTHTFLTLKKDNKYYWFEHSWKKFRGIHEYKTLSELLLDVRDKFITYELNHKYISNNLMLYEYEKPKSNISSQEFFKHCELGIYIDLEKQ